MVVYFAVVDQSNRYYLMFDWFVVVGEDKSESEEEEEDHCLRWIMTMHVSESCLVEEIAWN